MEKPNTSEIISEAPKKSKRKLILGIVAGSLLLVAIVFGATTNFFGAFKTFDGGIKTGDSEQDEVLEKATTTEAGDTVAVLTKGDLQTELGFTSGNEIEFSIMETGAVTDLNLESATLDSDDIFIRDLEVNDAYTHLYLYVGATEINLDAVSVDVTFSDGDNEVTKQFYAENIAAGNYDRISIDIAESFSTKTTNMKGKETTVDTNIVEEGEDLNPGAYTVTAELRLGDAQDTHNEVHTNDSDDIEFTVPMEFIVAGPANFEDLSADYGSDLEFEIAEMAPIDPDLSIWNYADVYIDEVSIDDDYTKFYITIGSTEAELDDFPIYMTLKNDSTIKKVGSNEDSGTDTIDVLAGETTTFIVYLSNFDVEIDEGDTCTLTVTTADVTIDGVDEKTTNNSEEFEFTMPTSDSSFGSKLNGSSFEVEAEEGPKVAGLANFDDSLSANGLGRDDSSTAEIYETGELELPSSVLNSDDIYVAEAGVHEDYGYVYGIIGSTEEPIENLLVTFTLTKGSQSDTRYIVDPNDSTEEGLDFPAGTPFTFWVPITDFTDITTSDTLNSGTYTITVTVLPDEDQNEHNEKGWNDSESTEFTVPISISVTELAEPDFSKLTGSSDTWEGKFDGGYGFDITAEEDESTTWDGRTSDLGVAEDEEESTIGDKTTDLGFAEDEEESTIGDKTKVSPAEEDGTDMASIAIGIIESIQDNFANSESKYDGKSWDEFWDVDDDAYYAGALQDMLDLGIVDEDQEEFRPGDPVNRAEIVKMVVNDRAFGYDIKYDIPYDEYFSDLEKGEYYVPYVNTAAYYGIISTDNDTFRPNDSLRRDEALKVIIEASMIEDSYPGYVGTEDDWYNPYSDVLPSNWFYEYVMEGVYSGVLTVNDGTENEFRPSDNVLRAEAITMISRLLNLLSQITI